MSEKGIVLLVEDNQKILDLNRRILEKEGVLVLTAKSIAQARERVKQAVPDVAVLDIMLPDGSGLDFISELRQLCETPPNSAELNPLCALFLTAKTERADILSGLAAGGNDYITKPYDIDEFRMRILGFLRLVTSSKRRLNGKTPAETFSSILSKKELAVALLAAKGLSNKEIGEKVFLSESRVKTCLSGIYRKLQISDKNNKRKMLAGML
ncbi:MAG: response regulator transcription factor [Treponema sp.]|jgi:DNA-binding NarL/FixJ family response regulator|nr:response regulator transcription factor [Treponema sp.]